jgi:tRNA(Ile)-lysidine synthase
MQLRDKLHQAITRYDLLSPRDRVLVAVSGGQDSLTLLHELAALAPELQISLVVAHLHHGLRGEEADADQRYVGELAAQFGLPYVTDRTDVAALAEAEKIGLEEAGRRARYRFFDRAADEQDCTRIALAHTATDRAETLLMNLFRGAGLPGLRSIPPRRGRIIRPLILVSRQETADYCRISSMRVCVDRTNLAPEPTRNRLRADLLPQLEREYGPGIEAALCRAAEHVLDEIEWTEPLVQAALEQAGGPEGLAVDALRDMPDGLRQRVLRRFLLEAGRALTDIGQERWEALEAFILKGQTGRRLELSPGLCVNLEYGTLRLAQSEEPSAAWDGVIELLVPGRATLPDGRIVEALVTREAPALPSADAAQAVLDADKAGATLSLRLPRPGDRFVPLGMSGEKKLQDFFVDNKVPPRARQPLLATRADGTIVWIVGHRVAQTARVDAQTTDYLTLQVTGDHR